MSVTSHPTNTVAHRRRLASLLTLLWKHHISHCALFVGNRNIFLELLPLVGSHDSILFVRDFVMGGTFKNDTAIRLLSSLPFNVHQPTEQLLTELEVVSYKLYTANYKLMRAIHSWTCCGAVCRCCCWSQRTHWSIRQQCWVLPHWCTKCAALDACQRRWINTWVDTWICSLVCGSVSEPHTYMYGWQADSLTHSLHWPESFLRLMRSALDFHGTEMFVTAFARAYQFSLFLARLNKPTPIPFLLRDVLIESSHHCVSLTSGLLPSGFATKILGVFLFFTVRATFAAHRILFDLITQIVYGEKYKSWNSCSFFGLCVSS